MPIMNQGNTNNFQDPNQYQNNGITGLLSNLFGGYQDRSEGPGIFRSLLGRLFG